MGAMVEPAPRPTTERPPPRRLGDTLGAAARKRPEGGRAKWIVWAVFAVPVLVIGILQMFGVLPNPVAEKVKARRAQQQHEAPQAPAGSESGSETGK